MARGMTSADFRPASRYTGDIDFFVAVSRENADRLIRVFERFGFST